jgi:hypothetical protein
VTRVLEGLEGGLASMASIWDRGLIKKAGSQHPDSESVFFLILGGLDGASLGLLEVEDPLRPCILRAGDLVTELQFI